MYTLDALDRGLIHALHLDARAPFTKIADVLRTSPQTIVRRYQRLRERAALRVVGMADPHRARYHQWIVRLTAAPRDAQDIAHALARRADTTWVRLTSGGTEIVAIVDTPSGGANPHAFLLRDVPRTASIKAVSAHYLLHMYLGGPTTWRGRTDALTDGQQRQLQPGTVQVSAGHAERLGTPDHHLLAVLRKDGRASYTDLAAATGWSASTVTRRLDELRNRAVLYFDVELDDAALGITASAMLWMSIPPVHLDRVASRLATHPELGVVATTTGRTNLLASVLSPGPEALHRYLTTRLAIAEIATLETAPILYTFKAVAPLPTTAGGTGR